MAPRAGTDPRFIRYIEKHKTSPGINYELLAHKRFMDDVALYEREWVQFQPNLADFGYTMRQRYDPAWVPTFVRVPLWLPDWFGMSPLQGPLENTIGPLSVGLGAVFTQTDN